MPKALYPILSFLLVTNLSFGMSNLIVHQQFWKDGNAYPSLFICINIATIIACILTSKLKWISPKKQLNELIIEAFEVNIILIVLTLIYWFVIYTPRYDKFGMFLFFLFNVVLTFVFFKIVVTQQRKRITKEPEKEYIVIGKGFYTEVFARTIRNNPWLGYDSKNHTTLETLHNETLQPIIEATKPSTIFINWESIKITRQKLAVLQELAEHNYVKVYAFSNLFSGRIKTSISESVGNFQITPIFVYPFDNLQNQLFKRCFDVLVGLLVFIFILSWLIPLFALLVKLDSKGPVFFLQKRIGLDGEEFDIIKFRSMRIDAEKLGPQLSSDKDNRITKLGRFMRKYRVDEFPQFLNVLSGEMSIVGPRPERQYFVDKIAEKNPEYKRLHKVKPGITSLGQVHYGYAENVDEMRERLLFDLEYIKKYNWLTDLKVIIQTIQVVVLGKGK